MKIFHGRNALPQRLKRPVVLTIGNFDGVHKGHHALLRHVVKRASALRGTAAVLTFDPHPVKLLNPDRRLKLLTATEEKRWLIGETGVDAIICFPFTRAFSRLSPETFVRKVLVDGLRVHEVVVGRDYAFGHGRMGTIDLLRALGHRYHFHVHSFGPVKVGGMIASSSNVRFLLEEGKVEKAAQLLGRPYTLSGHVVHGAGRGAGLGFPTANLHLHGELIPKPGVYVVRAKVGRRTCDGVANLGTDPTFGGTTMNYEVHLFNLRKDLYGKPLIVEFLKRLRDEKKFSSPAVLVAQIRRDVARAKRFFISARARRGS